MRRRGTAALLVAVATTLALTACSTSAGPTAGPPAASQTSTAPPASAALGNQPGQPAPSAPPAPSQVLASTPVTAASGGTVRSAGVSLVIPPGSISSDGVATISAAGTGVYDLAVSAPLTGVANVTVPLSDGDDAVVHWIDGGWVLESAAPGENTVTVDHLSPFSTLKNLAKGAVCLKDKNPKTIVSCLIVRGVVKFAAPFLSWLATQGGLGDACVKQILGSNGAPAVVKNALSGDCVGHAGESGYIVPTNPPAPAQKPAAAPPVQAAPQQPPAQAQPPAAQPAAPPPAPAPQPPQQAPPPPPAPATRGFHVEDSYFSGTWAHTDPNDGTWHSHGSQPANAAYW